MKLYQPAHDSSGEDNGQVSVIGGSSLFHGAPLFALKVASRIVDMTFFGTPEKSVGYVAEQMKSQLLSFIWVPWDDIESYVAKSDAILIGPGFMRYSTEKADKNRRTVECDEECQKTKAITQRMLTTFPDKKWVIDAGSLQTLDPTWIPKDAILTPNKKEFLLLFGKEFSDEVATQMAKKYSCIIVVKGPVTKVFAANQTEEIHGGNPGLTKGGSGDTQAGLTAALLAQNDPFTAACMGSQITKDAADALYEKQGVYYNSDDLAAQIPITLSNNFRK